MSSKITPTEPLETPTAFGVVDDAKPTEFEERSMDDKERAVLLPGTVMQGNTEVSKPEKAEVDLPRGQVMRKSVKLEATIDEDNAGCFAALQGGLEVLYGYMVGLLYFLMAVELLALIFPAGRLIDRLCKEVDEISEESSTVTPADALPMEDEEGRSPNFETLDANGDGVITRAELEQFMAKQKKPEKKPLPLSAFVLEEFVEVNRFLLRLPETLLFTVLAAPASLVLHRRFAHEYRRSLDERVGIHGLYGLVFLAGFIVLSQPLFSETQAGLHPYETTMRLGALLIAVSLPALIVPVLSGTRPGEWTLRRPSFVLTEEKYCLNWVRIGCILLEGVLVTAVAFRRQIAVLSEFKAALHLLLLDFGALNSFGYDVGFDTLWLTMASLLGMMVVWMYLFAGKITDQKSAGNENRSDSELEGVMWALMSGPGLVMVTAGAMHVATCVRRGPGGELLVGDSVPYDAGGDYSFTGHPLTCASMTHQIQMIGAFVAAGVYVPTAMLAPYWDHLYPSDLSYVPLVRTIENAVKVAAVVGAMVAYDHRSTSGCILCGACMILLALSNFLRPCSVVFANDLSSICRGTAMWAVCLTLVSHHGNLGSDSLTPVIGLAVGAVCIAGIGYCIASAESTLTPAEQGLMAQDMGPMQRVHLENLLSSCMYAEEDSELELALLKQAMHLCDVWQTSGERDFDEAAMGFKMVSAGFIDLFGTFMQRDDVAVNYLGTHAIRSLMECILGSQRAGHRETTSAVDLQTLLAGEEEEDAQFDVTPSDIVEEALDHLRAVLSKPSSSYELWCEALACLGLFCHEGPKSHRLIVAHGFIDILVTLIFQRRGCRYEAGAVNPENLAIDVLQCLVDSPESQAMAHLYEGIKSGPEKCHMVCHTMQRVRVPSDYLTSRRLLVLLLDWVDRLLLPDSKNLTLPQGPAAQAAMALQQMSEFEGSPSPTRSPAEEGPTSPVSPLSLQGGASPQVCARPHGSLVLPAIQHKAGAAPALPELTEVVGLPDTVHGARSASHLGSGSGAGVVETPKGEPPEAGNEEVPAVAPEADAEPPQEFTEESAALRALQLLRVMVCMPGCEAILKELFAEAMTHHEGEDNLGDAALHALALLASTHGWEITRSRPTSAYPLAHARGNVWSGAVRRRCGARPDGERRGH